MSAPAESPIVFPAAGEDLLGILHRPPEEEMRDCGLILVVGGPQYRVGSHRLFVTLARHLASEGISVLRFDYRGQGDSSGAHPGFENAEEDIQAAIDRFRTEIPEVERVALWGLCDAASVIAFYAAKDDRVAGAALINPWVREADGEGYDATLLRHYYPRRLLSRDFWGRLITGRVNLRDFSQRISRSLGAKLRGSARAREESLAERMTAGLGAYSGAILLILSGNDLTAREFSDKTAELDTWQVVSARRAFQQFELAEADHTFSQPEWTEQLCRWTATWLREL